MRWATVAAFCALMSLPAAAAQDAPTADGAQRFLATQAMKVATLVRFVDSAGRTNYVTGKYAGSVTTVKGGLRKTKETTEALPERAIDKQLADLRAAEIEPIDAHGRPNACATRITQVFAPDYGETKSDVANDNGSFSFKVTTTHEQWTYEPVTKFVSPAHVIDWSNVRIVRSPEQHVTVTSKGQAYHTVHLTYFAGNPDLADRIEYAMKFLAMSCNAGSGAGF